MKFLMSALFLLSLSQVSFAQVSDSEHVEDPYNRVCAARDSNGREFRYYTSVWNPASYTQRKAVEKCRNSSTRPGTCRPAGCREY